MPRSSLKIFKLIFKKNFLKQKYIKRRENFTPPPPPKSPLLSQDVGRYFFLLTSIVLYHDRYCLSYLSSFGFYIFAFLFTYPVITVESICFSFSYNRPERSISSFVFVLLSTSNYLPFQEKTCILFIVWKQVSKSPAIRCLFVFCMISNKMVCEINEYVTLCD